MKKSEIRQMIKEERQSKAIREWDEWKNTRIQAKNIFGMLKQKHNNNISDMKKGLEITLKRNKTEDDQAKIMWQEFNKYFKIKESKNMKKSEIRRMIREEIERIKESEYNERLGHYSEDHGTIYVDSNFINKSKGMLPNSELKHMGYGEFYIETRNGSVQFARKNDEIDGFVGRTHKMYDDKGGKLVKQLIDTMSKKKLIEKVS